MTHTRTYRVVMDTELEGECVDQEEFVITVDQPLSHSQAARIGNVFFPSRDCYVVLLEEL